MCPLDDSCNCNIWIISTVLGRSLIQPAPQEGLIPSWITYSGPYLVELWRSLRLEISHHLRQLVPILNSCDREEFAPRSSKRVPCCSLWLLLLVSLLCREEPGSGFSRRCRYWNTADGFAFSRFNTDTQVPQLPFGSHVLHSFFHPSDNQLDLLQFAVSIPKLGQPRWTQNTRDTLASGK